MRILIATFSFPDPRLGSYDGRFVLAEALAYAQNGAEVEVVTPQYPGAPRDERLPSGIRVRRFRYFWPARWQRLKVPGQPIYRVRSLLAWVQIPLLLTAFALEVWRRAPNASLIHAQWTLTALLALPARWRFGTRLVVTARGSDLRLLPAWLNRWLHLRVDAAIDCFGPQPWNIAYKAACPARWLTLPLLVDTGDPAAPIAPELAEQHARSDAPLIVLYIGRFDRIKLDTNRLPLLDLIEAAALLKAQGIELKVFYVGDGESAIVGQMREAIQLHRLAGTVTLLGPRIDVAPYVRGCDLGVGGIAFNGVVQDFTAQGRAQVLMDTTDNAATPWRDGYNALLVPPGEPAALAARIAWAAAHRAELVGLGVQARADMRELIADTRTGGRRYLDAFAGLMLKG